MEKRKRTHYTHYNLYNKFYNKNKYPFRLNDNKIVCKIVSSSLCHFYRKQR